jgi:translation initiation factor 1
MADKGKSAPFHNPFLALKDKLTDLAPGVAEEPAPTKIAQARTKEWPRAVVNCERKGHGGKEMTRITHMMESADEAQALVLKLKQQLGVGGKSEGRDILLQGDQRERVKPLLVALGVKRITIGN